MTSRLVSSFFILFVELDFHMYAVRQIGYIVHTISQKRNVPRKLYERWTWRWKSRSRKPCTWSQGVIRIEVILNDDNQLLSHIDSGGTFSTPASSVAQMHMCVVVCVRRKPCYRRENCAMSLKISLRIKFYNKSIMERLCSQNTATLSTRTHLAPKPAQNTLNHV